MRNLLIAILAFVFTLAVGDHVPWETYWLMSGSQVTAAWDPAPNATSYEWEVYSPVRKAVMIRGTTTQTQAAWAVFTGHNVFQIKSCGEIDGEPQCSEFGYSTEAERATVDGEAKGWWIFGVIGAPGPIEPVS